MPQRGRAIKTEAKQGKNSILPSEPTAHITLDTEPVLSCFHLTDRDSMRHVKRIRAHNFKPVVMLWSVDKSVSFLSITTADVTKQSSKFNSEDWLDNSSHFPPCVELEMYFKLFP
jgi:hypothetical protein